MHLPTFKPILFFGLVLFSFLSYCAPKKETVSPYDLKRVLERVAVSRIQTGLGADLDKPSPTDRALFEEACDIYRLPIEKAKHALKEKNESLYLSFYGNES
ncbi:LA_1448 family UV-C exposure upregulated protein [Leptospira sp. 'Mane']|uniref:LA_1448 family UV-C exposure upregulated protein n=1 Tax=Leptospira sp. 'Mane' TaxID=3387407 RepID=UPI00398B0BF3